MSGIKKILSLFIALSILSSNVYAVQTYNDIKQSDATILFSDNFESGISGWTCSTQKYFSGNTGKLVYKNFLGRNFADTVVCEKYKISNGHISFDMRAENPVDFAVMLRTDGNSGYFAEFDYNRKKISLFKKVSRGKSEIIAETDFSFTDKTIYNVHIALLGGNISVKINSVEYINCKDFSINTGYVGFTASRGEYEIDNFIAYAFDDEEYLKTDTVEETVKLYVATDGDDEKGDGSYEKPFATPERAKKAVTRARSSYMPIEVIFKEGEYKRDKSFVLEASDSGTLFAPVTYKAEEGKEVSFNGATRLDISAFKPITDESVISRLYPHVKDKVVQMDLSAQGLTKEDVDFVTYGKTTSDTVLKKIKFFLNDRPQQIAQWPNAGFKTIDKAVRGSTSSSNPNEGGRIFFSNPEPLRWVNAKDAFVEGNMYYEWYTETIPVKEINTRDMSIDLLRYSGYGVREGHEYKVINLVEEIDMPGEWYVDIDSMILYYYPEKELTENDVFEISTMKEAFVSLNNVAYVNFKDIIFKNNKGPVDVKIGVNSQFRDYGGGIEFGNKTHDIVIDGCTFKDIGGTGIRSLSYNGNSFLWGDMNITISNNNFYRCSVEGIRPQGGNAITLENANINIVNNFFYESEIYGGQTHMCGINIINNLSVRIFNHAYRTMGCEFKIDNNEIVFGAYGMSDMGAIYVGRDLMMHGSSISRNLIMDYGPAPVEPRSFPCGGIYLDDASGGIELTQNISRARSKNYQSTGVIHGGGADLDYYGNISVDANRGFVVQNRIGSIPSTLGSASSGALQPVSRRLQENEAGWVKKYPETARMKEWFSDPGTYDSQDYFTDNLATNCDVATLKTSFDLKPYKTGIIDDAYEINDLSIYVDPENNDYRLKMEAVEKYNLPQTLPNEENLDINSIGLQREMKYNEKLVNFNITYPENGEVVPYANKVLVSWQHSDAANIYEYIVAKDAECKEIIVSGETMDNSVEFSTLEPNKTYYVKVKAINGARIHGYEIENNNGVIKFSTPANYYRNTELLALAIDKIEQKATKVNEGVKAGQEKAGTKAKIAEMVNSAKAIISDASAQNVIDAKTTELKLLIDRFDTFKNTGYATLNLIGNSEWITSFASLESMDKGEKTVTFNTLTGGTVTFDEQLPNTEVVKFKYTISNLNGWHAIALRKQDASKAVYSDDGYYIVVKKDVIELQKKGTILKEAKNDGIVVDGKENEVTFGAVALEGGVNLYVEINGTVVFDYLDKEETMDAAGMFALYIPKETTLSISMSDNIPTDLFEPSAEITEAIKSGVKQVFDTKYNGFKIVGGEFTESGYKANPDKAEELIAVNGGEARWTITAKGDTTYEIWYYHHSGAENAKDVDVIVSGKDGTYRTKTDLSTGEEEYKLLGTFKFVSDDASIGVATVVFKTNGKLPVSSVYIREVSKENPDMLKLENQK